MQLRSQSLHQRSRADVQVDHGQRYALGYNAEQHEDVGDHDRRKQLKEVLDPQMDHPEAPEISRGEVVLRLGE